MVSTSLHLATTNSRAVIALYENVRNQTMRIVAPLETEDYVIQTAEFMSPPRWHLGHTSWFFETLLQSFQPGYSVHSQAYLFYFNSYYEGFGPRIERRKRGTKSRPTVKETIAYRKNIDQQMLQLLDSLDNCSEAGKLLSLVRLGLEHEMQHQELLVYDIKHLLCDQFTVAMSPKPTSSKTVEGMAEIEGGLFWLGHRNRVAAATQDSTFAFDNEKPAHRVFLEDFSIDRAPVSNGDFLEFIREGGYENFRWWYSEGWETLKREQWRAPLYWELHESEWMIRDFSGLHSAAMIQNEPVSHVSYYEAAAFAKWAGKRLPTEAEWEKAATLGLDPEGAALFPWGNASAGPSRANLLENWLWGVAPIGAFSDGQNVSGCQQLIGDVWEWTTSDYVPYPGFRSEFDEYNDKWFVHQKVLRGGSFATPHLHIRSTYRNFFHPDERWMISGFRCAKDV